MKKVLFVDNQEEFLNIFREYFLGVDHNYDLYFLSNIEEAKNYIKDNKIDALIVDYDLTNDMDGVKLSKLVDQEVYKILISGGDFNQIDCRSVDEFYSKEDFKISKRIRESLDKRFNL